MSTFYTTNSDGSGLATSLVAYFTSVAGILPPTAVVTVPTSGETIDEVTGELNGSWSGGLGGVIPGTGAGAYAQGVGMRQVWLTNGITAGRRVRGSTFLVPIGTSNYDSTGNLTSGVLSAVGAAALTFTTAQAGEFCIYSRPVVGRSGTHSLVTGPQTPDAVSWLVSRRR